MEGGVKCETRIKKALVMEGGINCGILIKNPLLMERAYEVQIKNQLVIKVGPLCDLWTTTNISKLNIDHTKNMLQMHIGYSRDQKIKYSLTGVTNCSLPILSTG